MSSPLRVLHFVDYVNRHDFVDALVRQRDVEGLWFGVCTMGGEPDIGDADLDAAGVPNWEIPAASRREYAGAAWRLAALLKSERIDVVHAHHYEPGFIAWLATRLHRRTTFVLGRHYADTIYLNTAGLKRRALLAVEATVNRGASRIIVPSSVVRSLLVDHQHVPAQKVVRIPLGFDPDKYLDVQPAAVEAAREELELDGRFVVGTFARLYPDKGHLYLLEALTRLRDRIPGLRWLIVGHGTERDAIERAVRQAQMDDVAVLTGFRRDALRVMAACDVVVQPSVEEAFGQVAVEAMWLGRPVVITDVSGVADVVSDGDTAVVVPARDAAALEKAVAALYDDPDLRRRLGVAAREHVQDTLVMEKVVPDYEAVYRDSVRASGRSAWGRA